MNSAIEINDITFSYGHHSIYKSFSLPMYENQITYIMGNNGCGKTTLLNIITGFLIPTSGTIKVFGIDIRKLNSKELAKRIAYVPQTIRQNIDFCVKDYLALGRSPYLKFGFSPSNEDYAIVEKYASEMGVLEYLNLNFNQLSGGQKQLVTITRALIQETPIVILDEPMSALDIGKQAEFLCTIQKLQKDLGKTLILTSHNPNHALQNDCNVCLIHERKVLQYGKNKEVLNAENIQKVYGSKVKIEPNNANIVFNI